MNIPQLTGLEALLQQQQRQDIPVNNDTNGRFSQSRQKGDVSWVFEESMDD